MAGLVLVERSELLGHRVVVVAGGEAVPPHELSDPVAVSGVVSRGIARALHGLPPAVRGVAVGVDPSVGLDREEHAVVVVPGIGGRCPGCDLLDRVVVVVVVDVGRWLAAGPIDD